MTPFQFYTPLSFFEKAGAPGDKKRRIGGIISTEKSDREDETILQHGLDFSEFLTAGWFNDNHSKETDAVLGYPDGPVKIFEPGDKLPDGTIAKVRGSWAEGYLLNTPRANKIWELGKALENTPRRLGFSVEGTIKERLPRNRKVVAKAIVRNVAITNCPVNTDSRLSVLAKSLQAFENKGIVPIELQKALGMGVETGGGLSLPAGSLSGANAGQVLAVESLEGDPKRKKKPWRSRVNEGARENDVSKSLTEAEAVAWVLNELPAATPEIAGRIVAVTQRLKASGRLF